MASNALQTAASRGIARGRRVHPRARVALPAVLETIEGHRQAQLHNLSAAGAMVETAATPSVGRDLVLKCFGIDALGVVIWKEGDCCGIEFYDPIDEEEVIRQRQLSDDELAQERWRMKQQLIEAAERWYLGKS